MAIRKMLSSSSRNPGGQRLVCAADQASAAAQDAAGVGHDIGEASALWLGKGVHRHEAGRLQLDATGPGVAQCLEHRPGDLGLGRQGIDVRAHSDRALRPGAGQAELHAPAHVLG